MGAALEIVDETPTGDVLRTVRLELASETVTAREIIEQRVRQEVATFNAQSSPIFQGLVQPTDTEAALNGYRFKQRRTLDADAQCDKALRAFEANGFLMLADDRQIEELDERIVIRPGVKVSFVKLVPLVGG